MRASSIDQDLCRKIAKRCIRVLVVACITLLVAAFVPARAICQERLKVIYSQFTMTNSATWFAREAGLFERHGLTADLVYVDSAPAVQALTAGAAPVATMSGGLAVGPYLNGLDIVMLAGWCNLNSYQLITRPEIRRVEDLRGKVIGIGRFGAAADWGLRLILRKLGINENKDVQIIQAGGGGPSTRLAAMEAKKLDATVLDSPQTVQARRLGFRALADGVELGIPFLQGGLVTRRAYVQAHKDTVRRLVRVIVEAIHYAKANREAALKVMQKYLRVQDREALEDAYESFVLKQFPRVLTQLRPRFRLFLISPPRATRAPKPRIRRGSSICVSSANLSGAARSISFMGRPDKAADIHCTKAKIRVLIVCGPPLKNRSAVLRDPDLSTRFAAHASASR